MPDKSKYIKKLVALHQAKTGLALSDDEASLYFENLVVLVEAIYQPIKNTLS